MNQLIEEAIFLLSDRGWQEIVPMFILAALRPIGLFYGFTGFQWAMSSTRILRTMLAIAVGLPMVLANLETTYTLIKANSLVVLGLTVVTEVAIGFALGFIASLPFFALSFAGAMTDQFRGETDSGLHTPLGGGISTFGLLYTVIGLYAFAFADGIGMLIQALYRSYIIWPLSEPFPEITRTTVGTTLKIFGHGTLLGIRIVMPLLLFLFVIELSTIVAARIGKRFNFYNFAFSLKNMAAVLSLPILGAYVWLFVTQNMGEFFRDFNMIDWINP
jgi:type III secretory pathway component EscT